jgi:hypothetical protein
MKILIEERNATGRKLELENTGSDVYVVVLREGHDDLSVCVNRIELHCAVDALMSEVYEKKAHEE